MCALCFLMRILCGNGGDCVRKEVRVEPAVFGPINKTKTVKYCGLCFVVLFFSFFQTAQEKVKEV